MASDIGPKLKCERDYKTESQFKLGVFSAYKDNMCCSAIPGEAVGILKYLRPALSEAAITMRNRHK